MLIAITRPVSPTITECELTLLQREPIDVALAEQQHAAYETLLELLGAKVVRVEAAPDFPDAVFVEDCAVVVNEVAVITRPGTRSRLGEVAEVARCLAQYRDCILMEEPATLDGGDVVIAGKAVYVGRSARTNDAGIEQLRGAVGRFGYTVAPVEFSGALHLKSVCTAIDDETLLLDPRRVDVTQFPELEYLAVPPGEWPATNVISVNGTIVMADGNPQTQALLASTGRAVRPIDISEFSKAEGAVSCKSILLRAQEAGRGAEEGE